MSRTYETISFFSDEIKITPHTATEAHYIGRPVSIREFAQGDRVSLSREVSTGEYFVEAEQFRFMEGPES